MSTTPGALSPEALGRYLGRINDAHTVPELATLEREIASVHAHDPAVYRLLAILSLKWKRIEENA